MQIHKIILATLFFTLIVTMSFTALAESQELDQIWQQLLQKDGLDIEKQSFCYLDADSNIQGRNLDQKIRPASVTKLYTTLWALEKLGPDHTYKTQILLSNRSLHIIGANDSFFTSENIFYLISRLNQIGIENLDSISFSGEFSVNWTDDPKTIVALLQQYMNTRNWDQIIQDEFEETKAKIKRLNLPIEINDQITFTVQQVTNTAHTPFDLKDNSIKTLVFESSPLRYHLKEMNVYSSNFISQKIFDILGGPSRFAQYLFDNFAVTAEHAYFYNGSGLDENYTTCSLTLKVIKKLHLLIEKLGLNLSDIISVPGSDQGTLRNRFTDDAYNNSLWAKTGTLRHTCTLSGILNTHTGKKYFAVFNHTLDKVKARKMQDEFVKEMFFELGSPLVFEYESLEYIPLKKAKIKPWF